MKTWVVTTYAGTTTIEADTYNVTDEALELLGPKEGTGPRQLLATFARGSWAWISLAPEQPSE